MANGMQIVSFHLVLNTDKIKEELALNAWCVRLDIPTAPREGGPIVLPPTWETVFEKIARLIVGSMEYKNYCRTGILDNLVYSKYLINDAVNVEDYSPKVPTAATKTRRRTATPASTAS